MIRTAIRLALLRDVRFSRRSPGTARPVSAIRRCCRTTELSARFTPVWVVIAGDQRSSQYVMHAVDAVGVVLSNSTTANIGVAFPWTAVVSIIPDRK